VAGARDRVNAGEPWSRAPANRARPNRMCAWPEALTDGGVPVYPILGRVWRGMSLCWRGTATSPLKTPCLPGDGQAFSYDVVAHMLLEVAPVLGPQAGHRPDAVQVVPQRPRLPPGPPGRDLGPFGEPSRRARPSPSTPDTGAVLGGRLVPAEQSLRFVPEQSIHDVGWCSPVGGDHSLPLRRKRRVRLELYNAPTPVPNRT
jgi:hypothetical protein